MIPETRNKDQPVNWKIERGYTQYTLRRRNAMESTNPRRLENTRKYWDARPLSFAYLAVRKVSIEVQYLFRRHIRSCKRRRRKLSAWYRALAQW